MLDLHVHVLPGIDDGPRTLEDALALARALADDGIEHIVATPHIYPGVFDNSAARIGETFDAFQAAVTDAGIELTMTWAAEVRICPEILDWIELRRLPMLNGSLVGPSTALIELPDGQIPIGTDKLMGMMLDQGITPLMAHPERNKAVMEQPTRLEALRRLGCKFQVTAGSLLGDFGTRAQTTAQRLLDAGWVDVVASDAHNRSSRRPRMGAARDWLTAQYGADLADRLTKLQPTEIAGISSFTLDAAGQRLVFRDLPATAALQKPEDWSVDWMLAPEAARMPEQAGAPAAPTDPASTTAPDTHSAEWSLIDFRIDAVVNELQQAALQADVETDNDPSRLPAQATASDRTEDEDWQLPVFGAATSARPPPPRPKPQPPLRPVPPPEVTARVEVAEVVQMAAVQIPAPTPAPAPRPVPEVIISAPTVALAPDTAVRAVSKGMRLEEVSSRVGAADAIDMLAMPVMSTRIGPMAQAGGQMVRMPSPVTQPVAAVPAVTVAATNNLAAVARALTAAARSQSSAMPAIHPAPVDAAPRGFRLSDLNPLPSRRR